MQTITQNHIEFRTPLNHKNYPFILAWSDKSGCTFLFLYFAYRSGILTPGIIQKYPWIHDFRETLTTTDDYLNELMHDMENKKPIIKITRDPYARCYSGYLEMIRPNMPETYWASVCRSDIMKQLGMDPADPLTFSFMEYLLWYRYKKDQNYWPCGGSHIYPQYANGAFEDIIQPTIIHIEDFWKDIQNLERSIGHPPVMMSEFENIKNTIYPHIEQHHHSGIKQITDPVTIYDHMNKRISINRNPYSILPVVTASTIGNSTAGELIRNIYSEDFKRYNYK